MSSTRSSTRRCTRNPRSRPAIWNDDRLGAFDEDECGLADEGDSHGALAEKVADLGERVEVLPDRLLVYSDDGDRVIALVHERGLQPAATLVRRSTLEDVFLRLTGRTLVD